MVWVLQDCQEAFQKPQILSTTEYNLPSLTFILAMKHTETTLSNLQNV